MALTLMALVWFVIAVDSAFAQQPIVDPLQSSRPVLLAQAAQSEPQSNNFTFFDFPGTKQKPAIAAQRKKTRRLKRRKKTSRLKRRKERLSRRARRCGFPYVKTRTGRCSCSRPGYVYVQRKCITVVKACEKPREWSRKEKKCLCPKGADTNDGKCLPGGGNIAAPGSAEGQEERTDPSEVAGNGGNRHLFSLRYHSRGFSQAFTTVIHLSCT